MLTQSMPYMAGEEITWDGKTLDTIYNEQHKEDSLIMGGAIGDKDTLTILVPVASFPDSDRPEEEDKVTVRSEEWRIDSMSKGDVRWELRLVRSNLRNG